MRQRSKIAACANASLRWHHRMHAFIQHGADQVDHFRPHAGKSLGQRVGAQQHHGARLFLAQRLAHAYRMRADQVHLELPVLRRLNVHVAQLAHAGIDGISNAVFAQQFFHNFARGDNFCARASASSTGRCS